MSELLIELYSEEIPPNLQINARNQLKKLFVEELSSSNLKYKVLEIYSTPTRLAIFVSGLPKTIKVLFCARAMGRAAMRYAIVLPVPVLASMTASRFSRSD